MFRTIGKVHHSIVGLLTRNGLEERRSDCRRIPVWTCSRVSSSALHTHAPSGHFWSINEEEMFLCMYLTRTIKSDQNASIFLTRRLILLRTCLFRHRAVCLLDLADVCVARDVIRVQQMRRPSIHSAFETCRFHRD